MSIVLINLKLYLCQNYIRMNHFISLILIFISASFFAQFSGVISGLYPVSAVQVNGDTLSKIELYSSNTNQVVNFSAANIYNNSVFVTNGNEYQSLLQLSNGDIYATLNGGGTGSPYSNNGVLSQIDLGYDINNVRYRFGATSDDGRFPSGKLIETEPNIIYGITSQGGNTPTSNILSNPSDGSPFLCGTLFKFDANSKTYSQVLKLQEPVHGKYPYSISKYDGTNIFFSTSRGGTGGKGAINKHNVTTGVTTTIYNQTISGTLMGDVELYNTNFIYGTFIYTGVSGGGALFKINTNTNQYTLVKDFPSSTKVTFGNGPGKIIAASNGNIYGFSSDGGSFHRGVIYKYSPSLNTTTVIHHNTDTISILDVVEKSGKLVIIGNGDTGSGEGCFIMEFDLASETLSASSEFVPDYYSNPATAIDYCFPTYNSISLTGCDSVVSPSGLYTWYSSGSKQDTLFNSNSCGNDSVLTISVTVNYSDSPINNVTICPGASYTFPDGSTASNITSPQAQISNILTPAGCNRTVTTNISINNNSNIIEYDEVCSGDRYTFHDQYEITNIQDTVIHTSYFLSSIGCDSVITTIVTVKEPITFSFTTTEADCGVSNGSIVTVISGGTGPYKPYWNSGQTSQSIANLSSGSYFLTVEDSSGCRFNDVVAIGNNSISVSHNVVNLACNNDSNGSIDLNISGNGPFQMLWDNGNTTEDLTGLSAREYAVQVTDANNCTGTYLIPVLAPDPLQINVVKTNPDCGLSNGSISPTVTGGTAPYQFIWSNSFGTFSSSSNSINMLTPDIYELNITDDNNCNSQQFIKLNSDTGVNIIPLNIQHASCQNDGAIDINLSPIDQVQNIEWAHGPVTEDLSSLSSGNYFIKVIDINGCVSTNNFQVLDFIESTKICNVTADTTINRNIIAWEKLPSSYTEGYIISREGNNFNEYFVLDTVMYNMNSAYIDNISDINSKEYSYSIQTLSTCNTNSIESAPVNSIHLVRNDTMGSFLRWNGEIGNISNGDYIWRESPISPWIVVGYENIELKYSEEDLLIGETSFIIESELLQTCVTDNTVYSSRLSNINSFVENNIVKVDENSHKNIVFFPNPVQDILNWTSTEKVINLEIYDITGKKIMVIKGSPCLKSIDISHLQAGNYLLKAIYENGISVNKVTKR